MKTIIKKAYVALALITAGAGFGQTSQSQCTGVLGAAIFTEDFGVGPPVPLGPALGTGITTYQNLNPPVNGSYLIATTGDPTNEGYINAPDHTGNPNGYMMVVNAAIQAGDITYRRRLTGLCPGTRYVVTAWLANNNFFNVNPTCSPVIAANLNIEVSNGGVVQNGVTTGPLPLGPNATTFSWQQFSFAFTTVAGQTTADLTFIDPIAGGCGNDFVLDDISVMPCRPNVTISAVPNKTVLCIGEQLTLQSTASFALNNPLYQWQYSSNGGATWSNIAAANSANYTIPSVILSSGGMYRLQYIQGGAWAPTSCIMTTAPLTFTVKDCGCCIGNICTSTVKNPLITSWEVPLGNNNYVFSRNAGSTGRVGVGAVSCVPGNLLEVNNSAPGTISGLRLTDLASATPVTSSSRVLSVDNNGDVMLVTASGSGVLNSCATTNYVPKTNSVGNFVCSQIFDNGTSVGVGTNTGFTYGSWPSAVLVAGPNPPPAAGSVMLNVNGVTQSLAYFAISDQKFKKDISKINNALDLIKKMEGKTYFWRTDEFKEKGFPTNRQYGFIAQELERVVPEAVAIKENGDRSVNYDMFIPILVQSVKEQSAIIDNLQKQIDELKVMVSAGSKTTGGAPSQNVTLSDKTVIALAQNVPNPFSESTVISYNIPVDFTKAQINFLTNDGKLIKTVEITTKGQNSLTVFASDLSFGSYSYSLIVDGKVIDTKRMIKQ